MRTTPMLLAALLATTCSAASDEPPTQLRIELDGKQYVTTAGAPVEVDVGGKKARLRIDELPWRHFAQGSLQFDYPRHFPWESKATAPRSWTLDGNDAVIMVFEHPEATARDADDVAADFEKALGAKTPAEHAKAVLRTERVGTLIGVASTVKLATSMISHEVFAFEKGSHAWLLALQDALDDQGNHSSEYIEMRKRLSATLEF